MGARRQRRALQSATAARRYWRERLLNGRDPEFAALHLRRAACQREAHRSAAGDGAHAGHRPDHHRRRRAARRTAKPCSPGRARTSPATSTATTSPTPTPAPTPSCSPARTKPSGRSCRRRWRPGLPAIIIDQGGITDQVTAGVNGFLCPADRASLRRRRAHPARSARLRQQMSINARRFAEQHPWEAIMAQLGGALQRSGAAQPALRPPVSRRTRAGDSETALEKLEEIELTQPPPNQRRRLKPSR